MSFSAVAPYATVFLVLVAIVITLLLLAAAIALSDWIFGGDQ